MNPAMQTTLWHTFPPKLIATILKARRDKEKDQLNAVEEIAGPVPEIPIGDSGMMSMEDICQNNSCCLPDVNRLHGYILREATKSSQCKSVKVQARSCWI